MTTLHFEPLTICRAYRRRADLDVVRVQDIGLNATPDPDILAWAAVEGRILLTHDRDTMASKAFSSMSIASLRRSARISSASFRYKAAKRARGPLRPKSINGRTPMGRLGAA